jgi:hypothetical protein
MDYPPFPAKVAVLRTTIGSASIAGQLAVRSTRQRHGERGSQVAPSTAGDVSFARDVFGNEDVAWVQNTLFSQACLNLHNPG